MCRGAPVLFGGLRARCSPQRARLAGSGSLGPLASSSRLGHRGPGCRVVRFSVGSGTGVSPRCFLPSAESGCAFFRGTCCRAAGRGRPAFVWPLLFRPGGGPSVPFFLALIPRFLGSSSRLFQWFPPPLVLAATGRSRPGHNSGFSTFAMRPRFRFCRQAFSWVPGLLAVWPFVAFPAPALSP